MCSILSSAFYLISYTLSLHYVSTSGNITNDSKLVGTLTYTVNNINRNIFYIEITFAIYFYNYKC